MDRERIRIALDAIMTMMLLEEFEEFLLSDPEFLALFCGQTDSTIRYFEYWIRKKFELENKEREEQKKGQLPITKRFTFN
jgi:hypothetical protein